MGSYPVNEGKVFISLRATTPDAVHWVLGVRRPTSRPQPIYFILTPNYNTIYHQ